MSMAALQKAVAKAIMQPLTRSEHMSSAAPGGGPMRRYAARFIKPNDRLTSFERLEIYNRQYWWRVLGSLAEDFPGLCAVLGSQRFEAMCKAYLQNCPSTSFTLRNLGARLESWLRKNPAWIHDRRDLALDMARIEWADVEAFDGEAQPTLKPEDLSQMAGPAARLSLQPYVRLLELRYPVDDLLLAVKHRDSADDFASNAMQERKKRSKVRAAAKLKPAQIFLIVHRVDYSVYFRRIEREEFLLLSSLRAGKTIAQAIEMAFKKSVVPVSERPQFIQRAFQTWATLGWFCRPEIAARAGNRRQKRA